MVWAAWLLFSCKAEDLRINIPEVGVLSLSQEDLRRDFWLAQQAGTNRSWYLTRMKQMGLESFAVDGGICVGQKDWQRVSVVESGDVVSQLGMAVQVSLAKVQHKGKNKYSFCVLVSEGADLGWVLRDMRGAILHLDSKEIASKELQKDIDYKRLIKHLGIIAERLSLI